METSEIDKTLESLQRSRKRWRVAVVALLALALAMNTVSLVRASRSQPMFDDAALDRLLHAIEEHDRGCATHATVVPASAGELRDNVLDTFNHLYVPQGAS